MKHIKLKGTKETYKIFDPYAGVEIDYLEIKAPTDLVRFEDSEGDEVHLVPEFSRDRPTKVFKCQECKADIRDGTAVAKLTPIDGKHQCWTCYSQY